MAGIRSEEMAESRWVRTELVQQIPEIVSKMQKEYKDFNAANIGSFLVQPDYSSSSFTVTFYGKDDRSKSLGGYTGKFADGKLVDASDQFVKGGIKSDENVFTGKREGYWYLVAQYDDPALNSTYGFPEIKASDIEQGKFYQISYKPVQQKSWKEHATGQAIDIPVDQGKVTGIVGADDVQRVKLADYSQDAPVGDVLLQDGIRISSPRAEITEIQLDDVLAYCPGESEKQGQKKISIFYDFSTSFQRDIGEGNKVRILDGMKDVFSSIGDASLPSQPSGFYVNNVEESSDNYLLWLEQVYAGMQRGDYKNTVIEVAGDGGHVLGLEKRGVVKDAYRDESGSKHDFNYKEFVKRFTALAEQNNVTIKFLSLASDEIKDVKTEYITNKVLEAVVNDSRVSGALQEYFSSGKTMPSDLRQPQKELFDKVAKSEKLSQLARDYFADLQENPNLSYVVRDQKLEDQVKSHFEGKMPSTLSIRTVVAPGEKTGLPVAANYVMGTRGFEQLVSDLGGETISLHKPDYEASGLIRQDKADLLAMQTSQKPGSLPYGTLLVPMETGMTITYQKEKGNEFKKEYESAESRVKVQVLLNEE